MSNNIDGSNGDDGRFETVEAERSIALTGKYILPLGRSPGG